MLQEVKEDINRFKINKLYHMMNMKYLQNQKSKLLQSNEIFNITSQIVKENSQSRLRLSTI